MSDDKLVFKYDLIRKGVIESIHYNLNSKAPKGDTTDEIEPGIVQITPPSMFAPPSLSVLKQEFKENKERAAKLVFEDGDTFHTIVNECGHFLKNKSFFEKHGILYKRGFLLYGPPGTGKTDIGTALKSVWVEKLGGAVMDAWSNDFERFSLNQSLEVFKTYSNLPLLILIDEFDEFIAAEERLATFSDCMDNYENIIFFCTTNRFNHLPERFRNRPGRFDKRILIDKISPTVLKLLAKGVGLSEADSMAVSNKCQQMNMAAITEIAVRRQCFNYSIDEAIDSITKEFFSGDRLPSAPVATGKKDMFGFGLDKKYIDVDRE